MGLLIECQKKQCRGKLWKKTDWESKQNSHNNFGSRNNKREFEGEYNEQIK